MRDSFYQDNPQNKTTTKTETKLPSIEKQHWTSHQTGINVHMFNPQMYTNQICLHGNTRGFSGVIHVFMY